MLEQWGEDPSALASADMSPLTNAVELSLLQKLIDYPEMVEAAATRTFPSSDRFLSQGTGRRVSQLL